MKLRVPFSTRAVALAATLALALGLPGCKKDGADTAPPGGGDGATTAGTTDAPAGAGVSMRYAAAAKTVSKTVKGTLSVASPQGAFSMKSDLTGTLTISDNGGGDLKVAYAVNDVREFKMEGGPPQQGGAAPLDPVAIAKTATGAAIVNDFGEEDAEKTKALAENQNEQKDPMAQQVVGAVAGLLNLPELPESPLEVGKPFTKSEEKEVPSPMGLKIPSEFETTFNLVSIDDSSGKRIATIKVEAEGSGAVEAQGQMISMDTAVDQTLVFNLDDQIPVSAEIEGSNTYSIGSMGSVEFSYTSSSTFAPG